MAAEVCVWLYMCVYVDGGMIREDANNYSARMSLSES